MKIMKVVKWAGLALAAGLAVTSAEVARNKNRCDYVRHWLFGQHDASSQQNHAASMNNGAQKQVK